MSKLYDAKVATKALLDAQFPTTEPPLVLWGGPTKPEDWREWEVIYFGQSNITVPDTSLRLGRTAYDEEVVIRVIIEVVQEGDDEQAVEARADALYAEIVDVFSANPTLGGVVNRLGGWTSNRATEPLDDRWRCQVTVEQACVGFVNTLS